MPHGDHHGKTNDGGHELPHVLRYLAPTSVIDTNSNDTYTTHPSVYGHVNLPYNSLTAHCTFDPHVGDILPKVRSVLGTEALNVSDFELLLALMSYNTMPSTACSKGGGSNGPRRDLFQIELK